MKNYEITFITKENLAEKPVKESIETLGGSILNISSIGERQFAYPIKKENRGIYTTVLFELEPDKFSELNKKLILHDDILRFLIVIKKVKETPEEVVKEEIKEEKLVAPVPEVKIEESKKEEKVEAAKQVIEQPVAKKEEVIPEEKPKKKLATKTEPKIEPEKIKVSKASKEVKEIETDTESEEDRLKALDKKLDELLKE
jgi:small subunit ribosomal protein S6